MIKKIILLIFLFSAAAFGDNEREGVSGGGGGSNMENKFITRSWQVIERAKTMKLSIKTGEIIEALETMLKSSPPKIDLVESLRFCNSNLLVLEKKDAWGCPGKIQLLSSFDLDNDALIFHELTRASVQYQNIDEGMRISISELRLNQKKIETFIAYEIYPKDKHTRESVEAWEKLYKKTALATNIQEDQNNYLIILVFDVIREQEASPHFIQIND